PFTDADLAEKLRENVAPFAGAAHTENLTQFLFAIERARSTRELTALLALPDNSGIDAMIAS
ncbi:MAG: hypothetical protein QOG83_3518, partial [Alphaproteobacteria bacterium]|nr:hypothetical protein [Alphaproteobacteria bacterium]